MKKELFTTFILSICFALIFVAPAQAQMIIVEEGLQLPDGSIQSTASCCARPGDLPRTGQYRKYEDGDDGELQTGVVWPWPRFTDNGNGTVTDHLTGLVWLKDADCFGLEKWSEAMADCRGLEEGECGLTDGSSAGDWRLPNLNELKSLIHYGGYPALPDTWGSYQWSKNDPFINVKMTSYRTSSSIATKPYRDWTVDFGYGTISYSEKEGSYDRVWPVRDAQ